MVGFYPNVTKVEVRLVSHFSKVDQEEVTSNSQLAWNVCLETEKLCYFKADKLFDVSKNESVTRSLKLMDGIWHVRLRGNLPLTGSAGLYVSGGVYQNDVQTQYVNCTIDTNNTVCASSVLFNTASLVQTVR